MVQRERRKIGELECRVIGPPDPATVAIFCHGFGAPGDDLVPLADEFYYLEPGLKEHAMFVFPVAPESLDSQGIPGGRAWWPLNVAQLQAAMETGDLGDIRNACPDELPGVRRMMTGLIEEIRSEVNLPVSQIFLGGFSQGSMVATDVALHLDTTPAGLVIWSGTLLNESEWTPRASRLQGIPVLQSHGRQDPILSFQAAESLRGMLEAGNVTVEFLPFDGGHTIPFNVLQSTAQILAASTY